MIKFYVVSISDKIVFEHRKNTSLPPKPPSAVLYQHIKCFFALFLNQTTNSLKEPTKMTALKLV